MALCFNLVSMFSLLSIENMMDFSTLLSYSTNLVIFIHFYSSYSRTWFPQLLILEGERLLQTDALTALQYES